MSRRFLSICVCLVAAAHVLAQSPVKKVQQPADVIEAYRVCNEFQRILAEDLDFDRAFEATFTKDPARRRAIAIAESELGSAEVSDIDDATLIGIYKDQMQVLLLVMPLLFSQEDSRAPNLFPAQIEAMFDRSQPKDIKDVKAYAVQLKQNVAVLRAHFDELAAKNASVGDSIRNMRKYLSKPLEPPNHVVKPITAYSKGRVLPLDAEYYQVGDFAVIREGDEMRIIGFTIFKVRW